MMSILIPYLADLMRIASNDRYMSVKLVADVDDNVEKNVQLLYSE